MTKKEYLKKIKDNFPKLKFKKIEFITTGYDDDVVILDKRIVFSFPKHKLDCFEKFQKELMILPLLNKKISLSIPNFIYISKDKSFGGYKYITGIPLSKKILNKLSASEKESLAKQLAQFVNELHSFPIKVAEKNNVSVRNNSKTNISKLVLTHQDLIDEHILINIKTKKVVGIIDFGDLQIADPTYEFSRIWRFGEEFLDLLLKYYKTSDKKIKIRSKKIWLKSKNNI
ncbi:MAG: aminoglycoside 3'-phosphotransferase/choline kinase family protein [Candidatus Magasanikbacteria bacterium]|jgi:aminoglycoside 2''-phosphotransferase